MNELTQYLTSTETPRHRQFHRGEDSARDPATSCSSSAERTRISCPGRLRLLAHQFPAADSQFGQFSALNLPQQDFWIRHAPVKDPGIYSFRQMGWAGIRAFMAGNTSSAQLETYMPGASRRMTAATSSCACISPSARIPAGLRAERLRQPRVSIWRPARRSTRRLAFRPPDLPCP